MDSIDRKLIKTCIKDGVALRDNILAGKYIDSDLYDICEQWLKNVIDKLATIREDYAESFEKNVGIYHFKASRKTKVMFAAKIMSTLNALDDILIGKYVTGTKFDFSFKTPSGIFKKHLELIYDGFNLYDAEVPEDSIHFRKGLGKNILNRCFPAVGIENRDLSEKELPNYNRKSFSKAFNRLQNDWATAFRCNREIIKTLIYRKDSYIHITEAIKTKWSL